MHLVRADLDVADVAELPELLRRTRVLEQDLVDVEGIKFAAAEPVDLLRLRARGVRRASLRGRPLPPHVPPDGPISGTRIEAIANRRTTAGRALIAGCAYFWNPALSHCNRIWASPAPSVGGLPPRSRTAGVVKGRDVRHAPLLILVLRIIRVSPPVLLAWVVARGFALRSGEDLCGLVRW